MYSLITPLFLIQAILTLKGGAGFFKTDSYYNFLDESMRLSVFAQFIDPWYVLMVWNCFVKGNVQ